jgi:hypothetical protein
VLDGSGGSVSFRTVLSLTVLGWRRLLLDGRGTPGARVTLISGKAAIEISDAISSQPRVVEEACAPRLVAE